MSLSSRETPDSFPPDPQPRHGEALLRELARPGAPVITYTLLALNVVVFLYGMYIAHQRKLAMPELLWSDPEVIRLSGGVEGAAIARGEWWRLLTACFVHFGWLHLGVNMYMLHAMGPLAERMWGRGRFLVLYLLAGLGGSCALVAVTPDKLGAGASGALWGVMVSLGAWVFLHRHDLPRALVSRWLGQVALNLAINFLISLAPGISAAGHFGGGATGLVVAVLLHGLRTPSVLVRALACLGLLAVPAACLLALQRARNHDGGERPGIQQQDPGRPQERAPDAVAENRERKELEETVLPKATGLERPAWQTLEEKARPVVNRHWRRRDPAAVEEALAALATARAGLREAVAVIERAGPYRTPDLEEARVTRRALLEEEIKYATQAEECLRQGEKWTPTKERGLQEQDQRVTAARRRWEDLLP